MKMKEILRKKNEKLNDLEEEAKKRAQYLLDRANNLRMEQEDEIKTLAEVILEAKCHAIRDAQVLEKKQIEKEMSGEEMRVDHLMEVERQKANQMQDEVERKRKEELYRLERLRIQAEIRNINDENQRRKMEKLNQERMADMRVLEYQRQKMVRCASRRKPPSPPRRQRLLPMNHVPK
ncbi:hypothetical protein E2320_013844 [Naja naja]|nr:hypothetical protein E2320_013844 [Naja naja]